VLEDRLTPSFDTLTTAAHVNLSSGSVSIKGIIAQPNDVNLFQVTLQKGNVTSITVTDSAQSPTLVAVLRLFDSSGHQLALAVGSPGVAPGLQWDPGHTGVFYVGVSSASDTGYDPKTTNSGTNGHSQGRYTLQLSSESDAQAEADVKFEPGAFFIKAVLPTDSPRITPATVVVHEASLPEAKLLLVPVLAPPSLKELTASPGSQTVPAPEVFVLFQPEVGQASHLSGDTISSGNQQSGGLTSWKHEETSTVEVVVVTVDQSEHLHWTSYRLGADEALKQRLQVQWIQDRVEEAMDAFLDFWQQYNGWLQPTNSLEGVLETELQPEAEKVPVNVEDAPSQQDLLADTWYSLPQQRREAAWETAGQVSFAWIGMETGEGPESLPAPATASVMP
jgi:hypothetical protein